MKRRSLLKLGVGAGVLLAVAGGGLALLRPGLVDDKLSPGARTLMRAVARAVLDGLLPNDEPGREAALDAQLARLDASIAGFPAAVREELSQVLALLGLRHDWAEAPTAEVQAMLERLRLSTLDTRQQIYRALRDLQCVSFFSDPASWPLAGYPGPRAMP